MLLFFFIQLNRSKESLENKEENEEENFQMEGEPENQVARKKIQDKLKQTDVNEGGDESTSSHV